MKTVILVFTLLLFTGITASAEDHESKKNSWDFFGLVFFPGIPTSSNDSNIAGIRVGLPVAGGKNEVRGIETAAIACLTQTVYGIQTTPIFCGSEKLTGIQASPVNMCDKLEGLQFGLFNASKHASFQLGILNYNEKAWIPWLPIINWNFDD
jgi:hypothetical protein